MAFIELVENAALLLALGVLYDTITIKPRIGKIAGQVLTGLAMGAIGLLVMATSWTWKPGIVFDTRSVLLSAGGLYFGLVPAAIAMMVTGLFRLYEGGGGTAMGVAVIVTSGAIGLAWRALRHRARPIAPGELYLFGLAVHGAMLLWMLILPPGFPRQALLQAGPPIMLIYPLCTVLLGMLLNRSYVRHRTMAELQRSEEQLRKSEERFRTLAQISPVGIFGTDAQGATIFWNKRLSEITGMTAEDGMGTGWLGCLDPEERARAIAEWERCYRLNIPLEGEYRLLDREGNATWAIVQAIPMLGGDGEIPGYMGTVTDVSNLVMAQQALAEYSEQLEKRVAERTQELREAQEQLVLREKLAVLGQMAGGVAHELRNPLGVISNAVYYLQLVNDGDGAKTQEYLDLIATEVHNAERITSDLLDFARIKASDRHRVAVEELVAGTLIRCPAPQTVRVTNRVPAGLPPLYVDGHQIGQVLDNLVTNAYQAMPGGGELTLQAVAEGNEVALSVADTGIGIAPEHMDRLFEPLFTTKAQGIGLGLAISRHLVEANGGRIEVESLKGEGSTFTVRLPIEEKGQ